MLLLEGRTRSQSREAQRARGEKPRYDGRCRNGRVACGRHSACDPLQESWRRPGRSGTTSSKDPCPWQRELDDLVIMRSDGIPTYNFGVVVDDIDMAITPRHSR